MNKTVSISCAGCSLQFLKAKSEIKRASKRGLLNHFCSNKCQATNIPSNRKGNSENLKKGGRVPDELSSFRYYAGKARNRNKEAGFDTIELSLQYLKQLWEQQKGVCPLTGWELILPPSISYWSRGSATVKNMASLDRIKPGEPYSQGNVRFIAHIANMAKFTYTDQDVIDFCMAVTKNNA